MSKPLERAAEGLRRPEVLAVLAVALRPPTDRALLGKCLNSLRRIRTEGDADPLVDSMARIVAQDRPEREYHRLFLGPARPIAPPFESVYLEGTAFGSSTRNFLKELREVGLEPEEGFRLPPDHFTIQLEYLANLEHRAEFAQAQGNFEEFLFWSERSRSFVERRLAVWLPSFLARLEEKAPESPYTAFVRAILSFLRVPTGPCAGEGP